MTNLSLPGFDIEQPTYDLELDQWYTPPDTARRICEFARIERMARVLEPSCGDGALIRAMDLRMGTLLGLDIDVRRIDALREQYFDRRHQYRFEYTNFLHWSSRIEYDVAVMNPPFSGGQTEAHLLQALRFARRVVIHCPLTTLESSGRYRCLWSKYKPTRMAVCASRPKYSGTDGGKTAMVTLEIDTRNPQPQTTELEWWP